MDKTLMELFRQILRGAPIKDGMRRTNEVAARTQPLPTVPGGPYHKLSKVYYYSRDARRLVEPPIEVYSSEQQKQIAAGQNVVDKLKQSTPAKNAYLR